MKIEDLKFDEKGLIPAVVIDNRTKKVLTVAYMNRESLAISLEEKRTCFWSRSRQELWRKGETSGNVQHIVRIDTDCDCDALTVYVLPEGPACHTGEETCFFNSVYNAGEEEPFSLDGLMRLIEGRKTEKRADWKDCCVHRGDGRRSGCGRGCSDGRIFRHRSASAL